MSTVPVESTPNCCREAQLQLSRDEPLPAYVPVTELSSRRADPFKTYSGSGAALVRASGAEVSSQLRGGKPTDSVLHPFKPEAERRIRGVSQTRAAATATHREAPHGYMLSPVSAPG